MTDNSDRNTLRSRNSGASIATCAEADAYLASIRQRRSTTSAIGTGRLIFALDATASRICLRLDYASRHIHRQMPGIHRVARLRRKIGADPRPFTLIPERPKHHVRFHRIVEQIRAEEAGLVEYLGTIVYDLQRRIRVRKAKHQW